MDVLTKEKIIELKRRIELDQNPPHVIALSEVRPKNFKRQLSLMEYQLEGYCIEHTNITSEDPSGRGLITYIRDSIMYNLYEPCTKFEEALIICIKTTKRASDQMNL